MNLPVPTSRFACVTHGLLLSAALALLPAAGAFAQREGVDVGETSGLAKLVPAAEVEKAGNQQYHQLLQQATATRALAPPTPPQFQRLRTVSERLIPHAKPWNPRASGWKWEVNLIASGQINAFCMPGGKIAVFT